MALHVDQEFAVCPKHGEYSILWADHCVQCGTEMVEAHPVEVNAVKTESDYWTLMRKHGVFIHQKSRG